MPQNNTTHRQAAAQRRVSQGAPPSLPDQQREYERTAVNRWPGLQPNERSLLAVLASMKQFEAFEPQTSFAHRMHLARCGDMPLNRVEPCYRRLLKKGMLLVEGQCHRINPALRELIARENKHAVAASFDDLQSPPMIREIFKSRGERNLYELMTQLCPNKLVFPNCALQSFLNFKAIEELPRKELFDYYMVASVDLLVVNPVNYLPLFAIELDSPYHDAVDQQKKDAFKDRLFALAGLSLLRLRAVGQPSPETFRAQVAGHLDALMRKNRAQLPGHEDAFQLLKDLSQFGDKSPVVAASPAAPQMGTREARPAAQAQGSAERQKGALPPFRPGDPGSPQDDWW